MLVSISRQRGMRNVNYAQLRGLLQDLVPFSLGTCAMCHMHAPATYRGRAPPRPTSGRRPAGWMNANEEM